MRSLPPARNQLRNRYRWLSVVTRFPSCLLWRRDFHLVSCGDEISSCRSCKLENSHPTSLCGEEISSCLLWRRDFILSILQVENLQPHGRTCSHVGNRAPTKAFERSSFSDSFMPGDSAFSPSAQAVLPTDSAEEPYNGTLFQPCASVNSLAAKHQRIVFLPARYAGFALARRSRFTRAAVAPEPRTPTTSTATPSSAAS